LIGATSTSGGTRQAKKIGIGWTNFATDAMETKKGYGRIIIVKKKRRIAICHPTEVRGDVIIIV
jgi:hypothetical protein